MGQPDISISLSNQRHTLKECIDLTAIILAGGKGSRLGRSKALETIAGKSLIQWVIDRLATISTEIVIATARGDCFASLTMPPPSSTRIKTVADIYPEKGPLGGIHSALKASSSSHAIVVGCDTPFLSVALLDYMIQVSSSFDVTVPRIGHKIEPLCAIYSRNCLATIQGLLQSNELQINKLFNMVKVRYIEEDEVDKFDPEHLSFLNINTQAQLDKARKLADEQG